jgi:hypothetical protein
LPARRQRADLPTVGATIIKQAPAADGLYAGVAIESYGPDYQLIGTPSTNKSQ